MRLVEATDAEQRARDRLSFDAWGEKLTLEQFRQREGRLRAHAFARDGLQTWLLVGDEVLASCETYRMQSFLGGQAGTSFGIASVFTEARLRGRRYASTMLQLLAERLRSEGPHAQVLYSDVGPAIYARLGYQARPARDRVWSAQPGQPRVKWLHEAVPPPRPDGEFVIWPTAEQLDWHLERERTYAALLGRPKLPACGATDGDRSLFWHADWRKEVLLILLGSPTGELLAAARSVAAQAGLPKVVCWSNDGEVARDGSLPMIRPVAPGVRAEAWSAIPRALWV